MEEQCTIDFNTIQFRYIAIQSNTLLHVIWLWLNVGHTLILQNNPRPTDDLWGPQLFLLKKIKIRDTSFNHRTTRIKQYFKFESLTCLTDEIQSDVELISSKIRKNDEMRTSSQMENHQLRLLGAVAMAWSYDVTIVLEFGGAVKKYSLGKSNCFYIKHPTMKYFDKINYKTVLILLISTTVDNRAMTSQWLPRATQSRGAIDCFTVCIVGINDPMAALNVDPAD